MTFSHLYRFPLNLTAEGLHRDDSFEMKQNSIVQWKPLNVITLGQRESDNINQMITISK